MTSNQHWSLATELAQCYSDVTSDALKSKCNSLGTPVLWYMPSNGLSPLPLGCMTLAVGNVNWRLWNKLGPQGGGASKEFQSRIVLGKMNTGTCIRQYTGGQSGKGEKRSELWVCLKGWTKPSVFTATCLANIIAFSNFSKNHQSAVMVSVRKGRPTKLL